MKLEKDKFYYCRVWNEDFRVNLDSAGLNFYDELISILANLSLEEPENLTLQDSDGNLIQKGNLYVDKKKQKLNYQGKTLLIPNIALNALGILQNGLVRNNDEIIFLSYHTGEKGAVISKSETYMTPCPGGSLETTTTPTQYYAIDLNGNLYKLNTVRKN